MFLPDMLKLEFPTGLISRVLYDQLNELRDFCFDDNEYGVDEGELAIRQSRILLPANALLRRGSKGIRLISVLPSSGTHHQMSVTFQVRGRDLPQAITFSLFPETRRAKAASNGNVEVLDAVSAPRRGKTVKRKKKRKAHNYTLAPVNTTGAAV